MELQNSFVVPSDVDTAWKTLLDVESVAHCMPGATLESIDGDTAHGKVKVKLGPVNMVYGGSATFVRKDEEAHVAVIEGTGKEARGAGTASGQVTATLVEEAPDRTRVDVVTEFTITGKAAQFGRGVMQDVTGNIVTQFATNLAATMAASATPEESADGEAPAAQPAVPRLVPVADDHIDLMAHAGAPVLRRVVPVVVGAVVVIGVVVWVARRNR